MRKVLLFVSLLLMVSLSGCCAIGPLMGRRVVEGSGRVESRQFPDLQDFTRVSVGNAFEVEIVAGDTYNVVITADENVFDRLDIGMTGDTLRIRLRSGLILGNVTHRVEITMPTLRGLTLSGAASGSLDGFDVDQLQLDLSGASALAASFTAQRAEMMLSGGSVVDALGSAEELRYQGSGASNGHLEEFAVETADVTVSGGSHVTVNASDRLDATASGAGTIEYLGDPELGRQEESGGANIRQAR